MLIVLIVCVELAFKKPMELWQSVKAFNDVIGSYEERISFQQKCQVELPSLVLILLKTDCSLLYRKAFVL